MPDPQGPHDDADRTPDAADADRDGKRVVADETDPAGATGSGGIYRWRDQLMVTLRALEPDDTQPMPRISAEPQRTPPDLLELLRALGVALLNSADSAATATVTLQDVATAYGVDLQAMVMPTGILLRSSASEVDLVTVPNRACGWTRSRHVNDLIALLKTGTDQPDRRVSSGWTGS